MGRIPALPVVLGMSVSLALPSGPGAVPRLAPEPSTLPSPGSSPGPERAPRLLPTAIQAAGEHPAPAPTRLPAQAKGEVIPVAPFDSVLLRFVREDEVDYGGLARDPWPLRRFVASLQDAHPDRFGRDARIAFWVNAYNALVLDGVIRRPGMRSVLDPGRILGIPTLAFFRERRPVAGRRVSLNDIEHRILREGFAEPRIHFVLNCASRSCPVLPARALDGGSLDETLEAATKRFLADPRKNRIDPQGRLELSAIFRWYRDDFRAAAGSVPEFVARHWPGPEHITRETPVRFLPYDWSLNGSLR